MGLHNVACILFPQYCQSDEVALVTRNTRAGNESYMKSFARKTLREEATLGDKRIVRG
jgi:hypothetical protein